MKWSLRGWWWADVETGMGVYSVKDLSFFRPHHNASECSPLRHCWERRYPSRPLLSHNWVHLSWTLIRLSHFLPRYHQQPPQCKLVQFLRTICLDCDLWQSAAFFLVISCFTTEKSYCKSRNNIFNKLRGSAWVRLLILACMNFKKCSMQSDLLPAKQHTLVTAQAGETTLGKNLASDWRMWGE